MSAAAPACSTTMLAGCPCLLKMQVMPLQHYDQVLGSPRRCGAELCLLWLPTLERVFCRCNSGRWWLLSPKRTRRIGDAMMRAG